MPSFTQLPLSPALLQALDSLGYAQMTAIQAAALPPLLAGRDVIAQARTGSGKTAAFGLALLARLRGEQRELQALVLCPTRELADQVSRELRALARFVPNIKLLTLCGGISIRPQLASLSQSPHIVVGTPGRIEDLLQRRALDLSRLNTVMLDEADRMLDMGFVDAISRILRQTPRERLTGLFSATYPAEIRALSESFQREPVSASAETELDPATIAQQFFAVERADKTAAVRALLVARQPAAALVFCNTRQDVLELGRQLTQSGIPASSLHGDRDQREREEVLLQFANGSSRVLIATDVAARGLDIKALPLVISYELPTDPEVHVHRIGRTGRAGASGEALSLVTGRERQRLEAIQALTGITPAWTPLPQPPGRQGLPPAAMCTVAIDAGRRDKLRPGDIQGAMTGAAGLAADQVGKIDIFPTRSYVAIARALAAPALKKLRANPIKGRRLRVRIL